MPVSNADILQRLGEAREGLTTPQVATELRISKPAAWRRLSDLAEDGLVERQIVGDAGTETWTLTEDGQASIDQSSLPGVDLS